MRAAQVSAGEQRTSPVLVGRDEELAGLVAVLSATPAVVVVEGEAGIGKSRLVEELLANAGGRRLVGTCRQVREPFPLGPVVEAIRGVGADLRGLSLGPVTGALRPLVPELANLLPAAPEPLDDRAAEYHRVFRGVVEILTSLGSADRVVLVLEDLHWADEHTIDFVSYLIADPPPRIALVVTYRGEDAGVEVRALTARLPTAVARAHVRLESLDTETTGALVAAILGLDKVSAEFAGYLRERTDGLPLAVEEVLALIRERGLLVAHGRRWSRKTLAELDVPHGIRAATLQRVARLPDAARHVVAAAAVLQTPAPAPVLLETAGLLAEPEAAGAVEPAVRSGLLVAAEAAVGFRHVLAAQAVYEDLDLVRRQQLHGRAASALRRLPVVPLGQLAHHLKQAGRLAGWAEVAEEAADQATALGHAVEAARLLEDVVRHAPLAAQQRGRLAIKLGWAALDTLHARDVIELLSQVLEQSTARPQRAEIQFQLSLALNQVGEDVERQRSLLSDAVPDLMSARPDLAAWAMFSMAAISPPDVPIAEDVRWVNRAVAAAVGVEDRLLKVFVLGKAGSLLVLTGDHSWRRINDQVREITGGAPRQRREANAFYSIGLSACYAGHLPAAGRLLRQGLDATTARENRRIETLLRSGLALFQFFAGEWHGLREEVAVLLEELEGYGLGRVDVEVVNGCLALAHGELDEAGERLGAVTTLARQNAVEEVLPIAVGAAVRVETARGDLDAALAYLDLLLETLDAKGMWPCVCWALPSAVQTWLAADMAAQARRFLDRAEAALSDLDAPLAPAALSFARGLVTGSGADLVAAARLYDGAAAPYEAARAREAAAEELFATGQDAAGDDQLRHAIDAYEVLGASWDYGRAAAVARRRGIGLPSRQRGGRRSYGESLSPREREVAELAATGRTNKEIAAELFVSVKTVNKHISAAMRKFQVPSRTALARRLSAGEQSINGQSGP